MKKRSNSPRSALLLILTALIWGVAFVAQSEGMNYVGAFTFVTARYYLGGAVLLPVIVLIHRLNPAYRRMGRAQRRRLLQTGILGGVCCGVCLFAASSLQQLGIAQTTVGKAGFITALYIVFVPLAGFVFFHRRPGIALLFSVLLATVGMYLLCITEGFSVGRGDVLLFCCALVFTLQILTIDYFSPQAEGVVIACAEFFTAGMLGLAAMLLFETPTLAAVCAAALPIAYAGVMSSGVAYTLQIVAQKDLDPAVASLIMSLESVFSLLAGWLILGEKLSGRELLGCVLVFAAILLAQLPVPERRGSAGKKRF